MPAMSVAAPAPSIGLLGDGDPPPTIVTRPKGTSPFVLIGDHAGNLIPRSLGTLGLPAAERERHIARDIGVAGMGLLLSERLDATFVRQAYSRLVVDCNRGPDSPSAIASVSDGTPVPGNRDLEDAARTLRFAEVHEPYHRTIAAILAARQADGPSPILIALHSFTPRMDGFDRPWQVGILHHLGNTAFASAVLARLRADGRWTVGDNQPYRMDGTDYSVPRHAYAAGFPYVEFEVRQDLIADEAGWQEWANHLAEVLTAALADRSID